MHQVLDYFLHNLSVRNIFFSVTMANHQSKGEFDKKRKIKKIYRKNKETSYSAGKSE